MGATIAKLKNNLHRLVVETEDQSVLQYMEDIFKNMTAEKGDWWDQLSERGKASVDRGLQQLDNGVVRRHDDVINKVNELLASRD